MTVVSVKISYTELGELYTNLLAISTEFDQASARRSNLQDAVDRPYGRDELRSVSSDFESQWDDRRNKLNEGLKAVTDRSKTVLEGFGDFDLQAAADIAAQMQETDSPSWQRINRRKGDPSRWCWVARMTFRIAAPRSSTSGHP